MDKSKAFTMYYFSIDGRDGLAKMHNGLCVESDADLETFLRSVAVSINADVERLIFTYRQKDLKLKHKLACLVSLQNIIDADVKVLSCNDDNVVIRRDIVAVKEMFDEYVTYITANASDEFKAHFDDVQTFLSSLNQKIKKLEAKIGNGGDK